MPVSIEPNAVLQDMSRDENGVASGLSKWSSMRSRVLQLSTPSGSGNSEAAALHLTTPISRYETSYPHGAGMCLPLFWLRTVCPPCPLSTTYKCASYPLSQQSPG